MEKTTKTFLLDDTSKTLKNQAFSERQLENGRSFSSTAPSAPWVHLHMFSLPESRPSPAGHRLLCHTFPPVASPERKISRAKRAAAA